MVGPATQLTCAWLTVGRTKEAETAEATNINRSFITRSLAVLALRLSLGRGLGWGSPQRSLVLGGRDARCPRRLDRGSPGVCDGTG